MDCSEPLDQKLIFRSADKIGHGALGVLRVFKACGPACFDAVQQPCHVAAQLLHHGAALGILQHLLGIGPCTMAQ